MEGVRYITSRTNVRGYIVNECLSPMSLTKKVFSNSPDLTSKLLEWNYLLVRLAILYIHSAAASEVTDFLRFSGNYARNVAFGSMPAISDPLVKEP